MAQHDRAWSGLEICIVGSTPLLPMRIEQTIADALPAHETRLESFENYNDAFEHCRTNKGVGLVMLLENQGSRPIEQVFAALAKHYEQRGLPCLGLLIAEQESNVALAPIDERLFLQVKLSQFKDRAAATRTMSEIWEEYLQRFRKRVIPDPLFDSLAAAATDKWSESTLVFYERAWNLLSVNLNISWLEMISGRLFLVLDGVKDRHEVVLKPHPILQNFSKMLNPDKNLRALSIVSQCISKAPLASRLVCVAFTLAEAYQSGGLVGVSDLLRSLPMEARPGTTALLKQLIVNSSRIEEFCASSSSAVQAEAS